MTVLGRMADCWGAITSGWIFRDLSRDENDAKCQHLEEKVIALQSDGSVEENLFAQMARPQFRR